MRKRKSQKVIQKNDESATENDSEEEYEVEEILSKRRVNGKTEYLVRWKGHSADEDTWQRVDTLNCPNLIRAYEESDQDDDEPLLKKAKKRGRPKGSNSGKNKKNKQESDDGADDSKEYEVQRILEVHHKKNGEREFLVRWKGYGKEDDSWEPEKHLNCDELIATFMQKVAKAKESGNRETRINRKATDRYVVQSPDSGRKLSGRTRGARRTYYEED